MATREQDVAKGGEVARLKKISERLRSAVAARQQQPGAAATAGQPRPQQPTARQLPATREAARAARLQQIAERVRALADSARSAAAAPEATAPARPGPEGPIERPTTLGGLRDQLGAMVDRPSPAPADAAALARPRPAAAAATPAERPAVQASPEQLAQMQEDVRRSMPGYVQPGPTVGAEAAKRVAETVPHERAIGLGDRFQHAANRALGTMLGDMPADLLQSIAVLQAELNTFGGDIGADEFKAYQVGQRIREWAEEAFPTNPRLQGEFIADVVPQAFGSSAGFLAAALLGAGMGLPAAATGGAVGALQMTGGLYNEARAMGATEEEARRISLLAGVPLGATEAIPLERMVDRFVRPDLRQGLLRFMAKSGAVGALEEAGQEGLQTTGQNIVAGATFDPGRSVTEGLGEAVAAGAITGGVMSGAMAGAGGAVQRRRSDQTDAEARAGASPTERLEQRRQGLRARLAGIIYPEGEQERQQLRQQRNEERRAAETDSMTGVANATAWERARPGIEADPNLGVVFFDVRGLKAANDLVGYKKGNEVIKSGARAIQEAARQVLGSDVRIFRTGGDEFLAVAPTDKLERLRDRAIELFPSETIGEFPVDLRAGIGRTMEEADAGVRAAKASETGPKPRDMKAGGQPTPAAAAPEPGPGEVRATEIGRLRTIRSSRLRRRGAEDELTGGEEAQVAHHAAQIEGAEPVPRFQPSSGATPPAVAMVPTAELHRDPERFQYKATGSEGVTAELKRVQKYDPKLGGIILVWKDPSDGRTYVVNGHHRHELAERTGHPEMLVRYINDEATTAAEARVIGALANIAEGRGTAVDAAKLFRDAELGPTDLEGAGVSLTGAVAKNGLALANLPTPIFSRVARGEISEARGAIIGGAGLTEEQQLALARLIEQQEDRGRKILDRDVAELARFVAGAGSAEAQQETLFGTETTTQSLALEKASLSAYIRERLAKERRTFGYVTKGGRAEQIEQAGAGKIDTETSGRIATEAAQAEEIYAKESVYSGPISDLLNAAAREVAAGAKERDVRERLYEQVRERIREIIAGRPAASAPGDQTASARGRDQADEVEPAPAASPEAAQLRAQLAELERKIAAGTASEMDRIDRQAILSQLDDLEGAAPPPTDTETADMFGAPAEEPEAGEPVSAEPAEQPKKKPAKKKSAKSLGKKAPASDPEGERLLEGYIGTTFNYAPNVLAEREALWDELRQNGATDEELGLLLAARFFNSQGGASTPDGAYAYDGNGRDIKSMKFWSGQMTWGGKPTWQGMALVQKVREIMKVPEFIEGSPGDQFARELYASRSAKDGGARQWEDLSEEEQVNWRHAIRMNRLRGAEPKIDDSQRLVAGASEEGMAPVGSVVEWTSSFGNRRERGKIVKRERSAVGGWTSAIETTDDQGRTYTFFPSYQQSEWRIVEAPAEAEAQRPSAQQLGQKPDKARLIPTRGPDGSVEIRVEPVAELPFGAVAPDDENRFFGSRVEVRDNAGNWIPGTVHRVLNGGRLIEVNVMPDDPQQSFRYGAEDVRVVERVDANAAAAERLQEQAAQIIEGLTDRQARNRIRTLRDGGQHGLANAVEALLEQRAAAQSDAARGEIEAAASGEQNTVFTKEAADAALEVLRRKLGGGEVRMGLDPELMMAAITRGGFHVERGIRTFAAWSRVMIQEVGEGIRPYLRSIYSAIRTWPGFDSAGMSSDAEVEAELSAEPEAAEEEAAPEPTPEPEPAPAPAEPPLVTQTPGTNLTWRTVTEWMEGMRTLDRRKSSATRHRQMSDHFRALTVGHIERETSTAALIELKEFLKTAGRRSQWVPVGGRDNVNHPDRRHYVELLDAIDRTITRHNRGEVGPVVQRTVETAGNRASEETMRALVRQAQSALRRDLQGEKPAPKTPKQLVDWAELNLGMKHEQDFLLDDVYDAFEGAANLIVHEMIGPQRKVGDPQIRSRLEALREFEERLFNGRTNSAEMKARQQFSTPMPIAEAALFAANVHTGEKVLEPSAGTGNLLNGLPRGDFLVHLNEGDPRRVAVLKELYENVRGAEITQGDALRLPLSGRRYSKIVTNPPYGSIKKKRQYSGFGAAPFGATDIAQRFFAQAMESLAPGGRIVGVMPYNTITDQGINFRRWINENHTPVAYIESPEGSYKTRGVEGRSGQAVIVVVDKGKAAGAAALGRKPLIVEKPTWDEWYEAIEQFGVAGPHFKAEAVEAVDEAPVEAPTEEERPRRQATIIDRSSGTGQTRTAPPEEGGTSDTTPAGTEGAVDPGARGPGEEVGRAGGDRGVSGPRQPGAGSGAGAAARTGRDAGVVATAAPGDTGSAVGAEAAGVVPGLPRRRVEAGPGDSEQRRHEIEAANHSPVFAPYAHGLSTSRAPHPRLVVETRSMAGMPAPPITATLRSSLTNNAWGRDGARGGVSDDQVDAALRVLSAWDRGHGMLIADDVGVGKSREAALVILEALERDPNAKILYTTKNENNVADVMAELRNVASGDPEGHFPAPFIYVGDYPGVKKGEEDLPVPDGPAIYFAHSYNFADFADALKDVQPTAWIADEAHEFKNLQSNRGMAWGELHRDMIQRGINNFAYFTATPAVSLDELAYLYGLRQWEVGGFTDWMDRKLGKATKEQQEAGRAAGQAAMGATRAENQLTGETEGEEGDRALQKGKRQFMSARNDAFAQKVTPAETEQVMRELKGSGHYIARDLWRGGVEFDVEWVDLLGVEGDPRVDPEERRYRLLQAAEEYTRHLPPDAAGEDVRDTFFQGVEARLAGGSNRPAFPSNVFGLGWNWADARIREEGSSPEAQAARERYNEAAELVRDITLAARRYGRMNQRDKRGGLERAQLQQYMKATLFNIRLPEVLKLADESLAQGRQVVISIHSVSGDEDTTPGAEGARDVNSALMAAINAINTREVTKEGRGAEAEFIDLGEMPEALMEVARLKERAAAMPPLRDPVRAIEEHFGPTRVAAITGRQTPKKRKDAMAEFQGGARDVAIISRAGKVGISLHDVNGKGRHLIVSDYEWSADLFKQELGRVDRTGQRSSPKITLVATNIAGERKFASTIAARMASLGATSKGSAESTGTDALDQFEMSGDIPLNAMRNAVEKLSDSERIYFTGAAYVEQRRLPDGTYEFVPIRRPGEKADMRNFLLEMLFHPVEMADRIMQKFVEERESLMTGEAVEALAARRTGRSHGDVLRRTVLSEDPELVLFEARNAAGEKVGLLQGFVTEHIIDIQRVRGTTSEGKPKPRRYVHFTPDDGSEPISGLEVSPGDARRLLAYYKRGERRRLTPADVWEDLQAGDKVQVQGPNGETWELHRRRDGRIQIRGASLSKHNMVLRQLPRGTVSYSQVGNYLFVQGDQAALERFLQRFPPEVQRPAEGEQTEMVREERVPFGQPIEQDRGPAQQSIFQQPRGPQGRTAALDEARQTVSLLEGKVARGAARPSEIRRYESARAVIRSLEGQGMSPEDVARATAETEGERPAMDPDVGDLFGGVMEERAGFGEVPTFYSRLVRAIENAPFSRAPAQQWAGYLGKQPIAAGEREWVGIDRFLDEAEGPLTKDDLLDAFEQGAIRLVETVLPQKLPPIEWRPSRGGFYSPEFTIELLPNGKYRLFARGSGVAELFDSLQAAKDRAEEIRARNGRAEIPTRYKLYTEQGGENYREILIQLGGGRERSISREEARSAIRSGQPVVARYQSDEGIASEIVTHLDDLDSLTHRATFSVTEEDPRTQFRSRHFDEPNILVHARVDDRELPNGERVLFIEEIQSDWHQKGRELGYRARGRKRELPPGFKVEPNPYAGGSFVVLDRNGDEVAEGPTREAAIQDYFNVLADAEARGLPIDAVPDAPFKKTDEWVGLMARRLIEEAVRGGYDRISWTTGEQQTARYNKLMRFSRIELEELDSGTRILAAYEPGDGRPVLAREVASDHEIAAYIGKELTQRLLTQPAEDAASGARRRRIEGPDLTIRGEGFRTHYDRIVPRAFQDAAKKLGAKVQIEPIEVIESPGAGANPSIRITDEMRRRVASEGQMLWEPQLDFFDRSAEVVFGSEEAAIQAANEVVESAGEFADVTPQGIPTRAGRLRRAGKRAVRRAWVDIRGQRIRGPEDIHRLIFPFRSPRHERFHVLLLKGERVLSHTMETSGAIDYVRLFAEGKRGWLNRIEKRARRLGADSLILVHNHPSGNPEESGADRHMTLFLGREFAQRGLRLHGHYIIDHEEGTWLEPNVLGGIQTERVKIRMEGVADDWTQYHVPSLRYDGAFTPRSVARLVGDVHDPNRIDVLYLSTQRHAVAIETHKPSSLATIGTWLPEQLRALGAADAVLITGTEDMRRRAVASVNAAADTLRRADFGSIVNGVLEVLLVRDSELEGKSQDELKATPLDRTSFPRARRVFEERAPFEDEPSLPETGRGVGRPGGRAGDEGSVPRRGAAALGRRGVGEAPEAGAPQLSRTARRLIRQRVKPRADLAESGAPAAPPLEREAAEAPNGSTLHPISPVELVRVASELLGGREPFVKKYLRARGRFYPDPLAPQIGLNPSLGRDYDQFARTVAHEVGHLIDFLPDADMNRGNILGRLGTLKNYLSHTLDEVPTNPSLALTPEDRKALRKRAEAEVKDEAKGSLAGKEAIREAVAERYRELVEQEIADRQLLTREAVMEELIALSEWWRPYDVDRVSDGYIKYRQSSPELYADAMSVLLNSPGTLKERAPRFFDAWFAYVERKPEVRQEYEDIQALLGAGEDEIMRARKEELEQDMERFEELLREADNWQDPQGVGSLLKQAFVDRAGPATDAERRRLGGGEAPAGSGRVDRVVRAIRRWRNAPPAHSDEHAVRMALEELNHAENVNRVMVMDIDRLVHRPLMEAGITPSQIHRYLMLKRIAEGDRGGMAEQAKELIQEITGETTWEAAREAYTKMGEDEDPNFDPDLAELAEKGVLNPHGYTPKEAARTLEALKRELDEEPGAERWALLEAKMRVFRQITFRSVEQAVELGVYNRETFEKVILPNKDTYVPFAVLDYFNGRMSAGVRQQMGTVKAIGDTYTAAILKTMALNRANEHQRAKLAVLGVIDVDFPGQAGPVQRIDKYKRERRPERGRENLHFFIDGKPHYREVPKYIARVFERADMGVIEPVNRMLQSFTYRLFHPLYVSWSIAWQTRNIPRDWKRTYKNLAAARAGQPRAKQVAGAVSDIFRLNRAYARTLGAAWAHARRQYHPLIRAMLEDRALTRAFHSFDPNPDDTKFMRLLQEYGISKPENQNLLRRVGRPVEAAGVLQESWTKAATYQLLGELGVLGRERAFIVRNYSGTPDSTRRGLASDAVNSIFMYANVVMAGIRADAEVATQPATAAGYWFRSFLVDFLPKAAMAAAAAGAFGDDAKEWIDKIPSYDLEKYITIPVPGAPWATNANGERKAVYIRIPHDDTNRILAGITWALIMSERPHRFSHALGLVQGELPGFAPWITLPAAWLQAGAGRNPFDTFRGREIVPRNEWEAGGWPRYREMIRWTIGELGIISQALGYFTRAESTAGDATPAETILRSIPGVQSLVKISDRGLDERRWWQEDWENSERAKIRADLSRSIDRASSERYKLNSFGKENLSELERARREQLNAWYRESYLPLTAAMVQARDTKDAAGYERARLQLERETEQLRSAPAGGRARSSRGISRTPSTGRTRSAGSLGRTRSRTTRTREPAAAGR